MASSSHLREGAFGQHPRSLLDTLIKYWRFGRVIQSIPTDAVVVDLGCGFRGDLLTSCASRIKRGIGLDLSVTTSSLPPHITLQQARVDEKLPIQSNLADVVTALAIIEHVSNPKRLLTETWRILKPGGSLLLTTPSRKAKLLLEYMAFTLKIISQEEIADHKRYYDQSSLMDELVGAGFKPHKIMTQSFEFGLNLFVQTTK